MKEKLRRLPDSELAVMQALWSADAPLTRPELDAALTHREWAATTAVSYTHLERRRADGETRCPRAAFCCARPLEARMRGIP